MQATALFSPTRDGFARSRHPSADRCRPTRATAQLGGMAEDMHAHCGRALREAVDRAERAERLLRARLIDLTWPAALSSLVGGFVAIVGLRLAGW